MGTFMSLKLVEVEVALKGDLEIKLSVRSNNPVEFI